MSVSLTSGLDGQVRIAYLVVMEGRREVSANGQDAHAQAARRSEMEIHLHVISRKTALSAALKHYFSGRPCSRGHLALRYTATYECIACHAERLKGWREKNKEHINAYNAAYQEENREYFRSWHSMNYEKSMSAKRRRHRMKMNGKLKISDPVWQRIDKARMRHLQEMAKQYEEWLGIKFEVDHIIPIVDEKVCGLHWHGNLHLIPMRLNRMKRGVITHETAA